MPVYLQRYLSLKKIKLTPGIKKLFYLSWEDALWDVLTRKKIPKKTTILVPEFFCGDVEKNMIRHGYTVSHYEVSKNLITTSIQLKVAIKKYRPGAIIIFHTVGITNSLLTRDAKWLKEKSNNSIIIEDCVHRIVNPEKIKILTPNHFVIDSLRKVVPLQGACLYGLINDLPFNAPAFYQSFWYSFKVHVLWFLMGLFSHLTATIPAANAARAFVLVSEKLMLKGYDLIGNSALPAPGLFIFGFLQNYINHEKIAKTKIYQAKLYEKLLAGLKNGVHIIPYSKNERENLRGIPLYIPYDLSCRFISMIRRCGIMLRLELNDSMWAKKHKVVYLPLGPHVSNKHIKTICNAVKKTSRDCRDAEIDACTGLSVHTYS